MKKLAAAALLAALSTGTAFAQTTAPAPAPATPAMPGMSQGSMPGMSMPARPGATAAGMPMSANHMEMMRKMEDMNKTMMGAPMTGDPDRDFVTMMMLHHQGAIDMARVYLRDGKDPAIRKIAQKIIADQEREIRDFKAWLAKHPAPAK